MPTKKTKQIRGKTYIKEDEFGLAKMDFSDNKFAEKYKGELTTSGGINIDYVNVDMDNIIENATQIKSWKRSPISETVNLTYIFLAFIIGFSMCAIVVTPLIINYI